MWLESVAMVKWLATLSNNILSSVGELAKVKQAHFSIGCSQAKMHRERWYFMSLTGGQTFVNGIIADNYTQ
jgi:hypothetical protein